MEEAKVTTGDYINNANVDKMNNIILNICDEGGYYFLDVNEVLSSKSLSHQRSIQRRCPYVRRILQKNAGLSENPLCFGNVFFGGLL
ncbi:MAG: hypothetical protein ACLR2E_16540 [Lachnospiraceae bacterium]